MVCLAVQEAKKFLNITGKTFVTGNPVRESIIYKSKAEARKALGLDDKVCIFSFGGSLGATMINRVAADLMEWHQNTDAVNHIHGYGQLGVEIFPKLLKDRGVSLEGKPRIMARQYIDDMDNCLAAADLSLIHIEDSKRYYPYNNFASTVIGFTGADNPVSYTHLDVYKRQPFMVMRRVVSSTASIRTKMVSSGSAASMFSLHSMARILFPSK